MKKLGDKSDNLTPLFDLIITSFPGPEVDDNKKYSIF